MTIPILFLAAVLGQTPTGRPGPQNPTDISAGQARATGASVTRALRDHLRTLPDVAWDAVNNSSAMVTATGATVARTQASRAGDWTTPEDYGAWGDYVPATAAGHDDTVALQAALNSGKSVRLAKGKIYKATAKLQVPSGTTIVGSGYHSSLIWCQMPDAATDCLWLGPTSDSALLITLRDFGLVGGATPGRAAVSGWSIATSVIDVYVNGGWEYMMRVWRVASGISGPEGGGVEGCHIRMWHMSVDSSLPYSPALTPNPKRGLYFRGWTNGSDIWAYVGGTTVGDGLHVEGTYDAANNARFRGLYQGIAGWGVYVGGVANSHPVLEDIHSEVNGLGGVYVGTATSPTLRNIYAFVTIDGAKDARVGSIAGQLTITAASQRTHIDGSVEADDSPITNASPTTTSNSFATQFSNGGVRSSNPLPNSSSEQNLILNGDAARFLSTTDGAATSVWGVSGYYTATRTGVGLTDTEHPTNSAYAAKMAYRSGWGSVAYWPIIDPAVVSTYLVGLPITASFVFKSATPGIGTLNATEMPGNTIGAGNGSPVDAAGIDAGNGWKRYAFTFLLTAAHITNGVGLQLAFLNVGGEPAYYIGEVQAVFGVSAPRSFVRMTRDRLGQVDIGPGGTLSTLGSAAPASGGDPVFSSTWRPGDTVWNAAPAGGAPPGWVCTVGGSPGTWKAMANLAP